MLVVKEFAVLIIVATAGLHNFAIDKGLELPDTDTGHTDLNVPTHRTNFLGNSVPDNHTRNTLINAYF